MTDTNHPRLRRKQRIFGDHFNESWDEKGTHDEMNQEDFWSESGIYSSDFEEEEDKGNEDANSTYEFVVPWQMD